MISRVFIDRLHELSIEKYGGATGIRDEACWNRPLRGPFKHLIARIFIPIH